MKTLAIIGAARKNGNTRALLDACVEAIPGQVDIVDAYRTADISPCIDCRQCWKKRACSINDGMQRIYELVDEANILVLAAPMYFHNVPGPMKSIIDRFQMYWAGSVRKDKPAEPTKRGAILMCGGAASFPNQFTAGEIVLRGLLSDLSCTCEGMLAVPETDLRPVAKNEDVKKHALELGRLLARPSD